jgi:hypothetical protein
VSRECGGFNGLDALVVVAVFSHLMDVDLHKLDISYMYLIQPIYS